MSGCKPGMYISRDRWGSVGGLTQTEQRTHFAFWCMLSAPLILGNDPRHMSRATLDILLASEIVALNQDALGKQARKVGEQAGRPILGMMVGITRCGLGTSCNSSWQPSFDAGLAAVIVSVWPKPRLGLLEGARVVCCRSNDLVFIPASALRLWKDAAC